MRSSPTTGHPGAHSSDASPDTVTLQIEGPVMFDVQLLATTVAVTIGFISALPPRQIVNRLRKLCSKRARQNRR